MQRRSTATVPKKAQQRSPVNNASGGSQVATVVRRRFGTGPFDKYWLNLDCCGLVCAGFTYCLHLYGCYAVCAVLLPPWMSYQELGEERKVRFAYHEILDIDTQTHTHEPLGIYFLISLMTQDII